MLRIAPVAALAAALLAAPTPAPVLAQTSLNEAARTIVILDGSGSMWGRIDGRPKLEIAREVLGQVLAELPPGRELGLMAYGHRRRGDCGDIELIVPPAPGTAATIAQAANAMRFQGRTPLTEAVRRAAQELNFTENPATVVLITDGIETCDADPCALGRELAAAGVGFTAHVVGFDMTAADGAQVACLAHETGGQYLLADDAAGLAAALAATVVAAPGALSGSLSGALSGDPSGPEARGPWYPGRDPMPGIRIYATGQSLPGSHAAVVDPAFPADGRPDLCRAICEEAAACHAWRHEPQGSDFVAEARCFLMDAGVELDWHPGAGFTSGLREGHLALVRPLDPATLAALATPLPPAGLTAPDQTTVLAQVTVGFEGPANHADYIDIVDEARTEVGHVRIWAHVRNGNPAILTAPAEPGDYRIRYIEDTPETGRRVLASVPLSVEMADYDLRAPERVMAGSRFAVEWRAPINPSDWIDFAPRGEADPNAYLTWVYAPEDGAPVELVAPAEPGEFDLRFAVEGPDGRRIQTARPITVTPAVATLDAPARVEAGAEFRVGWTGPFHDRHWIALTAPGTDDGAHDFGWFYLQAPGLPGTLRAPEAPGLAELRFILDVDGPRVIARRPVEVVAPGTLPVAPAATPAVPGLPAAAEPAPEPEPAPPAGDDARLPAVSPEDLAHACPADAPEPCRHDDPETGVVFMVAPGYGITQPYFYETPGGARADRPSLDLIRLADGETVVWVNLRQASGVPCVDNGPDRLCLGVTPGFEDQMAMMLTLGSLAGLYAATEAPEPDEGLGGPDDLAGTWALRIYSDGHPRNEFPLAVIRLAETDDQGVVRGTFRSAPDLEGFAGMTGAAMLGFDPDGRLRLDLVAEEGAALVLLAEAFGPWDWLGELGPPGPAGPAPVAAALSRVAGPGEDWRGEPWMQGEPDGMEAALQMGQRALQGMLGEVSGEDQAMVQILGQMMGAMSGQPAGTGTARPPSTQMLALEGVPLEGLSADEALMLLVPHLEVTP